MIPPEWNGLVLRLMSEAKKCLTHNKDGIAIITTHIVVDADGVPKLWVVNPGNRVEPSSIAKDALIKALT